MGVITGRLIGAAGPTALAVPSVGQIVENVVALRALTGSSDLPAVILRQYSSAGPNLGGGVFLWDTVARTDDGVMRFNAGGAGSSGAGWQRVADPGTVAATWAGVVADGVTDDTAALAAAVAALGVTGGTLILPVGTIVTDTLAITASGVNIEGAGKDLTIIEYAGAGNAVTFGDVPAGGGFILNCSLRDLTISVSAACTRALWLWRAVHFDAKNVKLIGTGADKELLMADYSVHVDLSGIETYGVGSGDASTYANGVRLDNCTTVRFFGGYLGNVKKCLWLNSTTGVTAHGTILESSWSGVVGQSGSQLAMHGCYVENCGFAEATPIPFFVLLDGGSHVAAYGCHVLGYASVSHAARVIDTSRLAIHGGRIDSNYAGAELVYPTDFTDGLVSVAECDLDASIAYGIGALTNGEIQGKGRRVIGTGSPEGAVVGNVGDEYHRTDGGAGTTLYVKESGAATNTGWVAHGAIGLGLLAPGSESYSSGQWHIQYQRLQLTSAQRLTLAGTARYILTDL